MTLYKLVKYYNKLCRTKRLAPKIEGDGKEEFEKEIVKVLRKFKLINLSEKHGLQRVTIVCDVDEYPKIKLECINV